MLFSDFFWLLSAPAWVSHSQHFMMSFNDASKLFSAPAWASHSLNFLDLIFPCFPRRGVFFRGISGYIARKSSSKVCWNLGSGTWELGSGTWKLEPGTQRRIAETDRPASSTMTRASSPGEHNRVAGGLAGELGHDTSQLARRARPCRRSTRRRVRPRHEPARPASTSLISRSWISTLVY
ncbi:hypothetical protein F2Q68_00021077 [Brassica cretica]|uniref:Secreted protein n=1 Tax=Brassica cretica TaxID=69181 RepID=A0A8S9FSY3_BRACR|nr:hypothetical protein F2Q68_00021077 [Brassica cretica]